MAAGSPNIVLAFADDWGRYVGSYAEHEASGPAAKLNELLVGKTPNFDRVAREGALFLNALVPNSLTIQLFIRTSTV